MLSICFACEPPKLTGRLDSSHSHEWATVTKGVWLKYPNPYSGHVVSVDVLDRTIDPETGVIRTERVLGCKQAAPRWVVKVSLSTDVIML